MKNTAEAFSELKEESIGLRGLIREFLELTDCQNSASYSAICKIAQVMPAAQKKRSSDVAVLGYIEKNRMALSHIDDVLLTLQRDFDIQARIKNTLIRLVLLKIATVQLAMNQQAIRSILKQTRELVNHRLEMGPVIPSSPNPNN